MEVDTQNALDVKARAWYMRSTENTGEKIRATGISLALFVLKDEAMVKHYIVAKHTSTVCGYPGRDFDWSKFDWEGKSGNRGRKAPEPWIDDGLIEPNCEYLHVPYDFENAGTIYRVRPNCSMYAGRIYRGKLVKSVKPVKIKGIWYWRLDVSG